MEKEELIIFQRQDGTLRAKKVSYNPFVPLARSDKWIIYSDPKGRDRVTEPGSLFANLDHASRHLPSVPREYRTVVLLKNNG